MKHVTLILCLLGAGLASGQALIRSGGTAGDTTSTLATKQYVTPKFAAKLDAAMYNTNRGTDQAATTAAASAAAAAATAASSATLTLSNQKLFNVVDYGGAVGNGTTDDRVAIQNTISAAIAQKGKVIFPFRASGYKTSDMLIIQPSSGTEVYLDMEAQGVPRNLINYTGASGTAAIRAIGLRFSTWTGIKVNLPTSTTGIVAFDLDTQGSSSSTSFDTFINCHVAMNASNQEAWRVGHLSQNGGDLSDLNWITCSAYGTYPTHTGQIGWHIEGSNTLANGGANLFTAFCDRGYSNKSGPGASGAGNGSFTVDGWFTSQNNEDIEIANSQSYSFFGGRCESGKQVLNVQNSNVSPSITFIGVEINDYAGDGIGSLFYLDMPCSLMLLNINIKAGTHSAYGSNMIKEGGGGSGTRYGRVFITGGSIEATSPFRSDYANGTTWKHYITGVAQINSSSVAIGMFPDENGGAAAYQLETVDYVTRISQVGGAIDAETIDAVDRAIIDLKYYGLITTLKAGFLWTPLGNNLAASLVKLLYNPATPSSMANTNFVEADYSQKKGFGIAGANTTKYLGTGVIPSVLGLVSNNISFGTFANDPTGQANNLLGITPATGTTPFYVSSSGIGYAAYNTNSKPGGGFKGASYTSTSIDIVYDGLTAYNINAGQPGTGTQNTEVNLFRSTVSGSPAFSGGKLTAAFVGSGLTNVQLRALARILQTLSFKSGALPRVGNKLLVVGNSIEAGVGATSVSNRLSTLVAQKLGAYEINGGASSSMLRQSNQAIQGGFQKYQEVSEIDANILLCGYGVNDETIADATANGDATIIADLVTKYNTMVATWKADGKRIVLFYPYNSTSNATKRAAYASAVRSVAVTNDVPFADGNAYIGNQTSPAANMSDVVHPNNVGHQSYANIIVAALNAYPNDFGNLYSTGTSTVNTTGNVNAAHFKGSTLAPTIAAGVGAGTSPTSVSVTGNDSMHKVFFTTGTSPASGVVATVTFSQPFKVNPPAVFLGGLNDAGILNNTLYRVGTVTLTGYTIVTTTTAGGTQNTLPQSIPYQLIAKTEEQ